MYQLKSENTDYELDLHLRTWKKPIDFNLSENKFLLLEFSKICFDEHVVNTKWAK